MKLKNLVFFLVILCTIYLSIDSCRAESQVEPSFILRVIINKIDWEKFVADVNVTVSISALPYNLSSIGCWVQNYFDYIVDNESRRLYGGTIDITIKQTGNWTHNGKTYYKYWGERNGKLKLFGKPELYPYDSYLINLTLMIPYFDIKNESMFSVSSYFRDENWFRETKPAKVYFKDWAHINYKVYIRRQPWTYSYLEMILNFAFLFLGGVFMLDPDELNHRLSVIIPLFIFIATFPFHFQASLPHRTGTTFYEVMLFILFFAVSMIGLFSILVYTLIKRFKNMKETSYFLDFLCLSVAVLFIYLTYEQLIIAAKYYPWIIFPSIYRNIFWLSFGFIFRFVINVVASKRKEIEKLLEYLKFKMKKYAL